MFRENGNHPLRITMTEGDFGIILPIELETENEETITSEDSFVLNIFKEIDTDSLVSKNYTNIQNNTIEFSLTEEESALLPVDKYYYDLDWYRNGEFMCNLVPEEIFLVTAKGKKVGGDDES